MFKAAKQVPDSNQVNQVAVAQAGAIPPLVTLLTWGTPGAKENAAGALWNIAGNADDQGPFLRLSTWVVDPVFLDDCTSI